MCLWWVKNTEWIRVEQSIRNHSTSQSTITATNADHLTYDKHEWAGQTPWHQREQLLFLAGTTPTPTPATSLIFFYSTASPNVVNFYQFFPNLAKQYNAVGHRPKSPSIKEKVLNDAVKPGKSPICWKTSVQAQRPIASITLCCSVVAFFFLSIKKVT